MHLRKQLQTAAGATIQKQHLCADARLMLLKLLLLQQQLTCMRAIAYEYLCGVPKQRKWGLHKALVDLSLAKG